MTIAIDPDQFHIPGVTPSRIDALDGALAIVGRFAGRATHGQNLAAFAGCAHDGVDVCDLIWVAETGLGALLALRSADAPAAAIKASADALLDEVARTIARRA